MLSSKIEKIEMRRAYGFLRCATLTGNNNFRHARRNRFRSLLRGLCCRIATAPAWNIILEHFIGYTSIHSDAWFGYQVHR